MEHSEEDYKDLGKRVLAIASVARKTVLWADKKIAEEIRNGGFDKYDVEKLTEFAAALMSGVDKDLIIDELQISPELVEKLDKKGLNW